MKKTEPCCCGSGNVFSSCCGAIIEDHLEAKTPEALMRSRYSAYVLHNEKHLLRTWDISTRPDSVEFDDDTTWLNLQVHCAGIDRENPDKGTVNFTASFLTGGELFTMNERSNFRRRDEHWYYIDGENETVRTVVSKKAPCPCGSGKKFKRCCLKYQ